MRRSRAGHVCVCVLFFVVVFFLSSFLQPIHSIEKEKKTTTTTIPKKKKRKKKIQGERGYAWLVCSGHTVLRTTRHKSVRGLFWSLRRTDQNED